MPCDGIAVANMNVRLAKELLASPEAITAVANLLRSAGLKVEQDQQTLRINGYPVSINNEGRITGYNAPQSILNAVREAGESVAGILTQQKVAEQVAQSCRVNEQQYTNNGYLVMKVNL